MERGYPLCPNVNKWPKGNDCHSLKCCYFSALHFKEGMKLDERGIMRDTKKGVVAFLPFCVNFFWKLGREKVLGKDSQFLVYEYIFRNEDNTSEILLLLILLIFLIFKVYLSCTRKSCA